MLIHVSKKGYKCVFNGCMGSFQNKFAHALWWHVAFMHDFTEQTKDKGKYQSQLLMISYDFLFCLYAPTCIYWECCRRRVWRYHAHVPFKQVVLPYDIYIYNQNDEDQMNTIRIYILGGARCDNFNTTYKISIARLPEG